MTDLREIYERCKSAGYSVQKYLRAKMTPKIKVEYDKDPRNKMSIVNTNTGEKWTITRGYKSAQDEDFSYCYHTWTLRDSSGQILDTRSCEVLECDGDHIIFQEGNPYARIYKIANKAINIYIEQTQMQAEQITRQKRDKVTQFLDR